MTKHRCIFVLAGRPQRGARDGNKGRVAGWSIRVRCSVCRATKRAPVNAAMMELKGAFA